MPIPPRKHTVANQVLQVWPRGVYGVVLRGTLPPTPPPARLLPSHLLSVGRLALREGVQHVIHLPWCSRGGGHRLGARRMLGYRRGCYPRIWVRLLLGYRQYVVLKVGQV